MEPNGLDDCILRENRRSELARRLISHGVRTQIITQLTGLTRNRLATVRRRLMVPDKARQRGPARNSLTVFLCTPRSRAEGAALASLLSEFEICSGSPSPQSSKMTSLELGERLCEAFEAYCTFCPETKVQLEELLALRNSLAKGDAIRLGQCRACKCLILIDRFDGSRKCSSCERDD